MMQLNNVFAKNVLADMMANRNDSDEYLISLFRHKMKLCDIVIFGE